MRTQRSRNLRCSTWPRKGLRKWLSLRSNSDDFLLSDSTNKSHCSDSDSGWLVRSSEPDPLPPPPPPEHENLRMFVGTWNVGGRAPPSPCEEDEGGLMLRGWLFNSSPQLPHIYVIGFQEIVPLNAGNVLGAEDKGPASTWISLIGQALNSETDKSDEFLPIKSTGGGGRYHLTACKQMVGIFLCVWARAELVHDVRNVRVSCVGTGIMGYMGNKGSVSISMTIRQSSFCFICTHLASGEKEGDRVRRNLDVMGILRRTRFAQAHQSKTLLSTILQHDKILWLGDLNYRLKARPNDTRQLLEKNDWQELFEKDQLRMEQRAGRVFSGWEEGNIHFPPTYKYLANSNSYAFTTIKHGDKPRTPAWCDRILWQGNGMKQISYSRGESQFSDHRPVHSLFSIDVDNYRQLQTEPASPTTTSCSNSSCSRVQAEELLLLTRSQSCLTTIRF